MIKGSTLSSLFEHARTMMSQTIDDGDIIKFEARLDGVLDRIESSLSDEDEDASHYIQALRPLLRAEYDNSQRRRPSSKRSSRTMDTRAKKAKSKTEEPLARFANDSLARQALREANFGDMKVKYLTLLEDGRYLHMSGAQDRVRVARYVTNLRHVQASKEDVKKLTEFFGHIFDEDQLLYIDRSLNEIDLTEAEKAPWI